MRECTKLFREGDRWVALVLRLKGDGLFVRTAYEGVVLPKEEVCELARQRWVSFFEEDNAEFGRFVKDHGVRSVEEAADLVIKVDGEYHGLSIYKENGEEVYLLESVGAPTEGFLPEEVHFLRHKSGTTLNGLDRGLMIQHMESLRERGWTMRERTLMVYDIDTGTWNLYYSEGSHEQSWEVGHGRAEVDACIRGGVPTIEAPRNAGQPDFPCPETAWQKERAIHPGPKGALDVCSRWFYCNLWQAFGAHIHNWPPKVVDGETWRVPTPEEEGLMKAWFSGREDVFGRLLGRHHANKEEDL